MVSTEKESNADAAVDEATSGKRKRDRSPDEEDEDPSQYLQQFRESSNRQVQLKQKAESLMMNVDIFNWCGVSHEKKKKLLRICLDEFSTGSSDDLNSGESDDSLSDLSLETAQNSSCNDEYESSAEASFSQDQVEEEVQEKVDAEVQQQDEENVKENSSPRSATVLIIPTENSQPMTPPRVERISQSPEKPMAAIQGIIDRRAKHVAVPLIITPETIHGYLFFITADVTISRFMRYDYCNRLSDKYLLATVCVYFARSGLDEFTQDAFFKFLYLANETHEDGESQMKTIILSALGKGCDDEDVRGFLEDRLTYWKMLNYETLVSRETLEEIFAVDPGNPVWSRKRLDRHGGAVRWSIRELVERTPKGCYGTPEYCECCVKNVPLAALPTEIRRGRLPLKKRRHPAQTPAADTLFSED